MIYWNNPFLSNPPDEKKQEVAKFVPFTELNQEKIFKIMEYVYKYQLYDINKLEIPEGAVVPTRRPIVLSFIILNTNKYSGFNYHICDEKIDIFIEMMNDLIPEEDRENFGIKLRCK